MSIIITIICLEHCNPDLEKYIPHCNPKPYTHTIFLINPVLLVIFALYMILASLKQQVFNTEVCLSIGF